MVSLCYSAFLVFVDTGVNPLYSIPEHGDLQAWGPLHPRPLDEDEDGFCPPGSATTFPLAEPQVAAAAHRIAPPPVSDDEDASYPSESDLTQAARCRPQGVPHPITPETVPTLELPPIPTLNNKYDRLERNCFVELQLESRVRAKLNDPNGKESLNQCFKSQATICHVLLPMIRMGYLPEDSPERKQLACVCRDF